MIEKMQNRDLFSCSIAWPSRPSCLSLVDFSSEIGVGLYLVLDSSRTAWRRVWLGRVVTGSAKFSNHVPYSLAAKQRAPIIYLFIFLDKQLNAPNIRKWKRRNNALIYHSHWYIQISSLVLDFRFFISMLLFLIQIFCRMEDEQCSLLIELRQRVVQKFSDFMTR